MFSYISFLSLKNRLKINERRAIVKISDHNPCNISQTLRIRINKHHNHPSNGWYAQGLKAQTTGQRLKPLAFVYSSLLPLPLLPPLKGRLYYLATLKRVFIFFNTQLIERYIMFLLFFDIFSDGAFIESNCRNVVPFRPKVSVPEFIF